eukprot:GHVH01000507.1.p1 GENE.GHVH01000507.1~~GHVH01000507.1.p1  ORF type:complete len:182 (+),score=18.40 GHVH01000507.1:3-548(+)
MPAHNMPSAMPPTMPAHNMPSAMPPTMPPTMPAHNMPPQNMLPNMPLHNMPPQNMLPCAEQQQGCFPADHRQGNGLVNLPPMPGAPLQRSDSEIQRLYGIRRQEEPSADQQAAGLAHALGLTDAREKMQNVTKLFSDGWKNVITGITEDQDEPMTDYSGPQQSQPPFASLMAGNSKFGRQW